jgi:PAS domain-containing protein
VDRVRLRWIRSPPGRPGGGYLLGYGYAVGITNILLVAWLYLRWPQYRWPMAMVLIAQVGARVVFLLEKLYVVRTDLPLDILGVLVVFVAWAIVLFGFRILDPVPLARQAVIAQMRDGLLVLDAEGRVASLNPAAQAMLGARKEPRWANRSRICCPWSQMRMAVARLRGQSRSRSAWGRSRKPAITCWRPPHWRTCAG